jgi:xylono-1,5-lactonase
LRSLLNCSLGEGVVWDARTGRVLFVDIHGYALHAWHPDSGEHWQWRTPQRMGWILPSKVDAVYVVGLQEGIARVSLGDQLTTPQWLARVFDSQPHMRLNDAKVDPRGVIWAGSLNNDDESRPDGVLFRHDPVLQETSIVDEGYCVCNGPAISPDGKLFLHTDSARKTIYAFDLVDGRLANKRIWKVLPEGEGYPDGMTFDAQGHLWLAHWGGSCISQYTRDGQLLQRMRLPASQVTNICFAGAALNRMFVTSARVGLSAEQLQHEPLAGSLFEVHGHGAVGMPTPLCSLPA